MNERSGEILEACFHHYDRNRQYYANEPRMTCLGVYPVALELDRRAADYSPSQIRGLLLSLEREGLCVRGSERGASATWRLADRLLSTLGILADDDVSGAERRRASDPARG